MKHIELLSELLYSAHIEGLANKKRVLDSAMHKDGLKGVRLRKAEKATTAGLNRLRRMFPDLSRAVRFHKISDFYSLAVAIQDLERRGFVLDNKKRNRLAWDFSSPFQSAWMNSRRDLESLISNRYRPERNCSVSIFRQLERGPIQRRIVGSVMTSSVA